MAETLINQNQIAPMWQRPSCWIEMRSGAIDNSVYFLVGHSADYQTYGTFTITPTISNSGTYDIFIDGVKITSAATSATATTLNWGTLDLATGFDVTYPTTLRTHIVRVSPTSNSNTITAISTADNYGLLWAHVELSNYIALSDFCKYAQNLEAVTAKNDIIHSYSLNNAFIACKELAYLPLFCGDNTSYSNLSQMLAMYNEVGITQENLRLRKVRFKDMKNTTLTWTFLYFKALEEVVFDNCSFVGSFYDYFDTCGLKTLPITPMSDVSGMLQINTKSLTKLEKTCLDLSHLTSLKKFQLFDTPNLVGLIVSDQAPFDWGSPHIGIQNTGLNHAALVALFNSLPTVTNSQVCNITGTAGASDLTADDLAIATGKGWTIVR